MSAAPTRRRGEAGVVTLVAVSLLGLLLLVGAALGVVVALVHAHRQAQSAADLAALSAARALGEGSSPCPMAGHIAAANGAQLDDCWVDGRDVLVEVTVRGPRWLGQEGDLRARARAGPS